jgi:hypothetical protein
MIDILQPADSESISENINECARIINGLISYYEKSELK